MAPSSKPKVLICGALVHAQKEVQEILGPIANVVPLMAKSRAEFLASLAPRGELSDLFAIYRHNSSANDIGIFDAQLIEALPGSCKFVCHNGAGYDQVDVQAASKKGITVTHTPNSVDDATATTAMYLIISALRQFQRGEQSARKGEWGKGTVLGHDPEGKVLGIVGMGGIGTALAKRAEAFSMRIQYHNRRPVPSSPYTYVPTLDELLRTSDVISLNLPLNDETRESFGKKQFEMMKDGAVLVNTARGGVLQEDALVEALESGKLSAAGLDVFANEPNADPRLLRMPQVAVLPHMGTQTSETQKHMEEQVLENLRLAIEMGKPRDVVKEQR